MGTEILRSQTFFLIYYGKGFTKQDVDTMPGDELLSHTHRLHEQLTAEVKAREASAQRMKSKG